MNDNYVHKNGEVDQQCGESSPDLTNYTWHESGANEVKWKGYLGAYLAQPEPHTITTEMSEGNDAT